jgi:hypothetical protein
MLRAFDPKSARSGVRIVDRLTRSGHDRARHRVVQCLIPGWNGLTAVRKEVLLRFAGGLEPTTDQT